MSTNTFRTSDGRTLAYRCEGTGPMLVCHGGGPGFSSLYLSDLGGLSADFSLVMLDPRGTGGSGRPADSRAYAIVDYVDDLEELRQHLRLERMDLLGHSHGGAVAILYAATHPERVARLVLAHALARFGPEQAAAMAAAMELRAGEPWYADACSAIAAEVGAHSSDEEVTALALPAFPLYFAQFGVEEAAYLQLLATEHINGDALRLWGTILPTFDLRPMLPLITAPALVITGQSDFITGPVCATEIAAGIADVRTVVLPDTGHFSFMETPEAFRKEMLAFLGGVAQADA